MCRYCQCKESPLQTRKTYKRETVSSEAKSSHLAAQAVCVVHWPSGPYQLESFDDLTHIQVKAIFET